MLLPPFRGSISGAVGGFQYDGDSSFDGTI